MRRREAASRGGRLSDTIPVGWRLRAIVAAAIVPPLLEVVSFARLERALAFAARSRMRAPRDADAAWWVDRALGRLPSPWRGTCLRRAAVLYYLLRAAGRAVEICIGVRRDDNGVLLAHAWLLLDGALYLEPVTTQDEVSQFTLIARFPNE